MREAAAISAAAVVVLAAAAVVDMRNYKRFIIMVYSN